MRRQNSWTDPTIIGEHRGTLWFHRPEINSISGNVVIRPFPSHASKFPPRRLTTWLASPGLIRTRPLHPIERNWLHASHPLTIGEAVECCGVSLPVPLFGSRSFNERPPPQAAIGRLTRRLIAGAKGHIFRDAGSLEVAEVSMARLTVFLARLIGLFTILLVPTLLVHGSAIIENTAADKPVMLTYGIISLAIGVAIIPGHNIWSGGALPVVVTLVGVVDPSEGSADLANRAGDNFSVVRAAAVWRTLLFLPGTVARDWTLSDLGRVHS